VLTWRRSYDTPPPPLDPNDPRCERTDIRYAKLKPEQVPLSECLKDTVERVIPFWNESIAAAIRVGPQSAGGRPRQFDSGPGEVPGQGFRPTSSASTSPMAFRWYTNSTPISRRFATTTWAMPAAAGSRQCRAAQGRA
jgi:hypothetical protein